MTVKNELSELVKIQSLFFPKEDVPYELVTRVFYSPSESADGWLVRCYHELNAPATLREIKEAEEGLGFILPEEYVQFLRISNGANLFVAPKANASEKHVRYHLFNTIELLRVYRLCCRVFRDNFGDDPEYSNVADLNYLPFCDATDDNYQGIVLGGTDQGKVFLLHYELLCRPYDNADSEYYYTIADSFEDWLRLIRQSRGWGGRGHLYGAL